MYNRYWPTFLLFFGAILAMRILSAHEQCIPIQGYSSCACRLNETNQVVNLLPLAPKTASDRPRFTANETSPEREGWRFSYNPCDGFDMFVSKDNTSKEVPCINVAVSCWTSSPPLSCNDLGDPSSAVFDYTYTNLSKFNSNITLQSNLSLTFTSLNDTLTKNRAVIYLVCNANMTALNQSSFHFLKIDHTSDKKHSLYYFFLESKCACPGLCGVPPKKAPSTKGGDDDDDDIWLIVGISIGAVVVLVLVILAVICCRTKRASYTSV